MAYKVGIADSDTVGLVYAAALAAGSGTPPYTWDRAGGSLPAGLALAGNGVVQGTPAMVGISTFNARDKDGIGASVTRPLDITIVPEPVGYGAAAPALLLRETRRL